MQHTDAALDRANNVVFRYGQSGDVSAEREAKVGEGRAYCPEACDWALEAAPVRVTLTVLHPQPACDAMGEGGGGGGFGDGGGGDGDGGGGTLSVAAGHLTSTPPDCQATKSQYAHKSPSASGHCVLL